MEYEVGGVGGGGGDFINDVIVIFILFFLFKINSGLMVFFYVFEGGGGNVVRKIVGVFIVWRDLIVIMIGKRKYFDKVVKSLNGYVFFGIMIVIMGFVKLGKFIFLRVFVGK